MQILMMIARELDLRRARKMTLRTIAEEQRQFVLIRIKPCIHAGNIVCADEVALFSRSFFCAFSASESVSAANPAIITR